MPAYLLADETITDPAAFEEYKRRVLPIIQKFGGRFLSRGGTHVMLETGRGWEPGRLVIIEFPDVAAIQEWYDSPEYRPVRDIRLGAAQSTLIALDSGSA
jgi:uncharacterized protein (DUF1330 family)